MSFSPNMDQVEPARVAASQVEDIKTRLFDNWDETEMAMEQDQENVGVNKSAPAAKTRLSTKIQSDAQSTFMKVFLRIRPFTDEEIAKREAQGVVRVLDNMTVRAQAPLTSKAFKSNSQTNQIGKFSFTRVFKENTTQRDFFRTTTLPMLQELLAGKNCLMFTTGVTNSGKTYTIQGTPDEPGILPRAVDVIFNSIEPHLGVLENLRPTRFCEVKRITASEVDSLAQQKRDCLELSFNSDALHATALANEDGDNDSSATATDTSATSADSSVDTAASASFEEDAEFERMVKDRVAESTCLNVDPDCKYSVFVTYIEVYNERIYDLLEPPPGKKEKRRVSKRLRLDKNKNIYVEGLREIQVETVDEAFRVLGVGRRNRRVAANNLNINSSRSHCIFTLKIVRFPNVPQPHYAHVSQLSLVDLAGSERNVNTRARGMKLKEAANINKSIMTLGQCIEILRHNQATKDDRRVPFRDSKLTRLFQSYLLGMGSVRMVVNISACATAYDETLHVLKFSAVARKITQPPITSKIDTGLSTQSTALPSANTTRQTSANTTRGSANTTTAATANVSRASDVAHIQALQKQLDVVRNHNDTLQDQVFELQKELERAKTAQEDMELRIREEIAAELSDQFVEVEETYEQIFRQQDDIAEETREKQLAVVTQSVARHATRSRLASCDDGNGAQQRNKRSKRGGGRACKHDDAFAEEDESEAMMDDSDSASSQPQQHLVSGAEMSAMRERVHHLESQLRTAQQDADAAKQAIKARTSEFSTKEAEYESVISDLKERLDELQAEHSQLMDTTVPLETFDAETKRMEDQANEYLEKLHEMEERLEELQTSSYETARTLGEAIETQERHISDLKEQLEKVTEAKQEEAERLEATISTLRDELQRLKDDGCGPDEHTAQEIERFKMQVAHLKNKKKVLEEKTNDLRAELEHVKGENDRLKAQLADMVSEQLDQEMLAYSTATGASSTMMTATDTDTTTATTTTTTTTDAVESSTDETIRSSGNELEQKDRDEDNGTIVNGDDDEEEEKPVTRKRAKRVQSKRNTRKGSRATRATTRRNQSSSSSSWSEEESEMDNGKDTTLTNDDSTASATTSGADTSKVGDAAVTHAKSSRTRTRVATKKTRRSVSVDTSVGDENAAGPRTRRAAARERRQRQRKSMTKPQSRAVLSAINNATPAEKGTVARVNTAAAAASSMKQSVMNTILSQAESPSADKCISSEDSVVLTPKRTLGNNDTSAYEGDSFDSADTIDMETFEREVHEMTEAASKMAHKKTPENKSAPAQHRLEKSLLEPLSSKKKRQSKRRKLGAKTTTTVSPVAEPQQTKSGSAMGRLLTPIARRLRPRRNKRVAA
ncbi:hypothetical protein PTSG_11273 [Salpingoeca rosetta]|uniref:Kinesin motor domain-containing protein n=1 Tax=Salpingoeca rosetta (strain ATCC 50818 / BSB-021) TaxID=946362 RepID=F2USX7_SALR5|nr:uncharacterized protein PTSG_11273 [Salpingoeca rosetta]EGD81236.1 hypothetical protein PTSG_11273 [Salpingoeca rosetta]|eukprot:XP_004987770.1 hypothetical protein PTSG_11273 [Salpingoeca rosetta]